MILSFSFQCRLFAAAVSMGLLSAFIYHILFALCMVSGAVKPLKGAVDIIYWCLFSLAFFFFMLRADSGEVRPFCIAGSFSGMLMYYILIKEKTDRLLYPLFVIIKKFILFILNIIKAPFYPILCPFYRNFNKFLIFFKKSLQNRLKCEKITLSYGQRFFLRGEKVAGSKDKKKIKSQNKQS